MIILNFVSPMTNLDTSGYTLMADSRIALASSGSSLVTVMVIRFDSETAEAAILQLMLSTPRSSLMASVRRLLLKIYGKVFASCPAVVVS